MKNLTPVTREEKFLHAIAIQEPADITPVTGEEKFLAALASGEAPNREPKTRKEYFLNECANGTGGGDSGDFKLATCTLEGFSFQSGYPSGEAFVYVHEGVMTIGLDETLFNGMQIVVYGDIPTEISVSHVENCVFSGDCEFTPGPGGGVLAVTGDFTITKGA